MKVMMLEKKVNELLKNMLYMKEALRRYHTTKNNHNHTTSILEILTRLLYLKKENRVELQMESTLLDFYFCGVHGQNLYVLWYLVFVSI